MMNKGFVSRASIMCNEYLLKTEELFVSNKDKWIADFVGEFLDVCAQIRKIQDEIDQSPISYLEYTMLLTNFLNRDYIVDIFTYGDESYLDENQRFIASYDISYLFIYFDELWNKLLLERKRYVGNVSARDVKIIMMNALTDFYAYLVSIARFAIAGCIDNNLFKGVNKSDNFYINVGKYMESTQTVYRENKCKDIEALANWFDEKLEKEYAYGDYSGLDFSDLSFSNTQLSYSSFRRAHLNNADFTGCALVGTSFYKAGMEHCRLDNCCLNEADFSNAVLKDASFINAYGRAGLSDEKQWHHVGFLPVNFRNADLTNANFTRANLVGADFTGAVLDGANFTKAVLDGAVFNDIPE